MYLSIYIYIERERERERYVQRATIANRVYRGGVTA